MYQVGRTFSRSRHRTTLAALLLTAALLSSSAFAYDSITFGVQLAPPASGAVPITANVTVPLTSLPASDGTPVTVALRGDLSYAIGSQLSPTAGVLALLSASSRETGSLRAYLGTGIAVASAASTGGGTQWAPTAYSVVGWQLPLSDLFAVRLEGLFNTSLRSATVQVGLDVTPWGAR